MSNTKPALASKYCRLGMLIHREDTEYCSLKGEWNSADGTVNLWDLRNLEGVVSSWEVFAGGLASFDVHPAADVFIAYAFGMIAAKLSLNLS